MAFHVSWKGEGQPERALTDTADEAFRLALLRVAERKQPLIAQIDEAELSAVERLLLGRGTPPTPEEDART